MHQRTLAWIFLALLAAAGVALGATAPASRAASSTDTPSRGSSDWTTWSGPAGNLTSLGNGLADGGSLELEPLWSRPLGSAYSGILVKDGRVVTTFSDGATDYLVALDATSGAEHWRYRISETYKGDSNSDDGPLSTPRVVGGLGNGIESDKESDRESGTVYGLGTLGDLFAVSLDDGEERWRLDLVADFGAVMQGAGFTTAPTVIGDLLVVETGGDEGRSISAFERATGALRWSTGDETVTYQSPLTIELDGVTMLVAVTDRSLLGLAPETGEVLWQHRHTEGDRGGFGATQPVPVGEGGILLIDGLETALFRVDRNGGEYTVEEAWRSRALRSQGNFATPVPYEGYLYGFARSFLTCVDAATGEIVWRSRPPGIGNLVLVDGHLVMLVRSGEIVVAKATPEGYSEVSRVQALDRGYFTRPSFADGRIYVRNLVDISAIGVRAAPSAPEDAMRDATTLGVGPDWDLRGEFGAFVTSLATANNKDEMIERFLADQPTLPIIEGNPSESDLVHFVYHGEVEDLAVSGNFIRGGGEHEMHRIDGTDFYFRSYELPENAVYSYRLSVFDERMTDPRNPQKTGPEGRERSLLATSGWEPPAHLRDPEGERGRIETLHWKSERLDNERDVQIYLPAGYDQSDGRYPVLVVNDGQEALATGEMDKSLDNLIGTTVAPVIVAFVPNIDGSELSGRRTGDYTRAQAKELIPLVDGAYRTEARRESRAVMGQDPYGGAGFAAMYLALHHPDTFSKAAVQSYENGVKMDLMAAASGEKHDLELVFHWSSYDSYDPFFDFDARRDSRNLVAALEENGYSPTVLESDDGVGWGMWQGQMAEILETLFPLQ